MIAVLVALSLGAAPPPAGGERIPEGRARYRVEIGGTPVGVAELAVECAARSCTFAWTSDLRLPAASGGGLRSRRIHARVDRAGRLVGSPIDLVDGGARRASAGPSGLVPLSLAELVLAARRGGCVAVLDEETGRRARACAELAAGPVRIQVPGAVEEVTPGEDGFPEEVAIAAQATRFLRDPLAEVPASPPPLEGRVPGPDGGGPARRFCGRTPDAPAPDMDVSALPEPRPDGRSCREQARDYVARALEAGLTARVAVGVASDGEGFVWHAWAEVRTPSGWIAIDPAFGQRPAVGPRFTVARHGGDAAGVARAGRRILACWGRARVE